MRRMLADRLARIWVRGAAVATALLLAALAAAPAGAAAAVDRAQGTHPQAGKAQRSTVGSRPARLTLITGDTVVYARDAGGHVSATVTPGSDRSGVSFRVHTDEDGYYVLPSDAEELVFAGALDKRLFNVQYLADNGYGAPKAQVPVIVQYRQPMAAATLHGKAEALPASTAPLTLGSIDGAAVRVDKRHAGSFWKAVRGGTASGRPGAPDATPPAGAGGRGAPAKLSGGLAKVWLDGKVKSLDDVSNQQIGAPVAWAAGLDGTGVDVGVIDTGIDANHPDLAGKVDAAQNFVPAGEPGGGDQTDVTDRFGHGTHVASIIAGTGAASGGRYKGVAPGAKLIVAKALSDAGSGSDSTIIAAMQWESAIQHARIVSMSLGGGPTDGTDPLSQAVNDLTAHYGTLFVIAAGNSGPDAKTVATPGAASSALTVGAVDSADRLAFFSSRGPRLGDDFAVKPEITAPGWNIIAARAAGTALGADSSIPGGGPIDDFYTAASGTSMATPHVSGAVAALLEEHPDWTAPELKAALVATAHDIGESVYGQGAGRLDLGRAVTQQVFVDTPSVSAGFEAPYTGQAVTRRITYRNTGASPVTLTLSSSALAPDGSSAPAGTITVAPTSLTVPAGGAAGADLTVDPGAGGSSGVYSGRLVARDDGGDQLTVPIGFVKHPPFRTLRVRVLAAGKGSGPELPDRLQYRNGPVIATRVNDTLPALQNEPLATVANQWRLVDAEANTYELAMRLPQGGIYQVLTMPFWWDRADGQMNWATLVQPEVALDEDTTVTFDLADLARITMRTPRPSEGVFVNELLTQTTASGLAVLGGRIASYQAVAPGHFWLTPTRPPAIGDFQFYHDEIRTSPQVAVDLLGASGVDLHPRYASEHNDVPKFTSDRRLDVVTEADLRAGRDVRGKLVLLDPASGVDFPASEDRWLEGLALAIQRGAAGALTDSTFAWAIPVLPDYNKIPLLWVTAAEGARARAALSGAARVSAKVHAQPRPTYEYKFVRYWYDQVPRSLDFAPRAQDLTQVQATYHAQYHHLAEWGDAPNSIEVNNTFTPIQTFSIRGSHSFVAPSTRTEYFNTTGPDVLWSREYEFDDHDTDSVRIASVARGFTHPTSEREDWNEAIVPAQLTPGPDMPTGFGLVMPCDGCRQGDILRVRSLAAFGLGEFADASDSSHNYQGATGSEEVHLFRGGTEVERQSDAFGLPYYAAPESDALYRFTDEFIDGFAGPHAGTKVTTTWTFHSARPSAGNVKWPPHACIDDLLFDNADPCAWLPLIYLRYHFGTTAQDTAPAGRPYTSTITAQDGDPATAAPLSGLQVWISPDHGQHWTQAQVTPGPDRTYQVSFTNPTLAASPNGTVTVKARGCDAAGNCVDQTIQDAYVLR